MKNDNHPFLNHFSNNGHSLSDITICPIEAVTYLKHFKERELYWIEEIKILGQKPNDVAFAYGRPQAKDKDTNKLMEMNEDPKEGPSSDPQIQSATVTGKRKQSAGDPKTLNKKQKNEEKGQCVFSPETKEHLSVCKEASNVLSTISNKLDNVSCQTSESKEFLENLKQTTKDLKKKNPFDKIYIGLFGRTGAGKSSLINAILKKDIVPSGSGEACTSVCVQVEANTKNNKYRAEIEFISKEDWESELQFLLKELSKDKQDEEVRNDDEDGDFLKSAEEKFKTLYGEEGFKQDYKQLMGNKKVADTLDKGKKMLTFASPGELYYNISCYIRSSRRRNVEAYWPLVKCVTIYVPDCPALPEGVVLVDLPGAGDVNKQRNEMWKESINKCASVWIVNEINRALSDGEGHRIFQSSLKTIGGGGVCHNITFICTKTDIIKPKEIKRDYRIDDKDLKIHEYKNAPDYTQREERACIIYRNAKIKEDFENDFKHKVMDMLIGDHDASESFFNVFTVSSEQYCDTQEHKATTLTSEDTEIPMLMEHMKKLYMSHCEKKAKEYLTQVSAIVSFLHFSQTLHNTKLESFALKERERLKKELSSYCETMRKFLSDVQKKLDTSLEEGVREAQKNWLKNSEKIMKPAGKNFRGYHRTLKAMCRNNGYFRSSTGDIIDLNYTISEPMYAKMNKSNMFVKIFSSKSPRNSIIGKLESFDENFIDASQLKSHSKESNEKYLCLIYIKTEQKKLLNTLEQEILKRKKRIYNSISVSVQETLEPVYTEYIGTGAYTLKGIQDTIKNKIESCKNEMFKHAKVQMIRLFDDLREWIVMELEMKMTRTMTVALGRIPHDLNNLSDVSEEFEAIKKSCEALKLKIIA